MTSLMEGESVSSITSRSIPMPSPPVGGMPCSSAVRKSSSTPHASSSPAAFLAACASNRARWSTGSVSSENALASSRPTAKSSNRSVTPGRVRCGLASGDTSVGWSRTKVGCTSSGSQSSSKHSASSSPSEGASPAPATPAACAAARAAASPSPPEAASEPPSASRSAKKSNCGSFSATSSAMVTRRHGGARSMEAPWYSTEVPPATCRAAPATSSSVRAIMSS
mmetsp:Transcript_28987/g.93126  ORF Transcript_28987/g.93126 Transcript_28987/m.93126 type:complete len:224 (-) Transcript_28987:1330-2001(-)